MDLYIYCWTTKLKCSGVQNMTVDGGIVDWLTVAQPDR